MAKQIFLNALNIDRGSDYFEQGIINMVWRELESRFGFPPKEWQTRFAEYCEGQHLDRINGFYSFGQDIINPILNEILCRKFDYPTFQNLVVYLRKRG